ncbi:hypothetical protein DEO72_LG10g2489 [Vigna unguiculata]|uniref:Transposase n=1 Tax=Vigna unguiculata TaxID=3917 RepID=A0A4D6NC23_VIGUN|nr:hypothetical protein DEO72_LG10g1080 [Vigna unguiculata]QCE11256.1 hypothetical protein DEO72_LG10g2489 [Vigna unguiculata]
MSTKNKKSSINKKVIGRTASGNTHILAELKGTMWPMMNYIWMLQIKKIDDEDKRLFELFELTSTQNRNGKDQGSINLLQSSNITKRGLNQGIGKYTGKICADKATIEAVIQQEHEKLRLHQAKLDNLQAKYKVMM